MKHILALFRLRPFRRPPWRRHGLFASYRHTVGPVSPVPRHGLRHRRFCPLRRPLPQPRYFSPAIGASFLHDAFVHTRCRRLRAYHTPRHGRIRRPAHATYRVVLFSPSAVRAVLLPPPPFRKCPAEGEHQHYSARECAAVIGTSKEEAALVSVLSFSAEERERAALFPPVPGEHIRFLVTLASSALRGHGSRHATSKLRSHYIHRDRQREDEFFSFLKAYV